MRSRSAAAMLTGRGFDASSIEGGMRAWRGLVSTGAYEAGMFLLAGGERPEDLIALAVALEEGSAAFYRAAREAFRDKEAEGVFASLIKAEEGDRRRLLEAYGKMRPGQPPDAARGRGYMEGAVSVEEAVSWLKGEGVKLYDALEASMAIETNSLDFYMKVERMAGDEAARAALVALIEEEKGHLKMLGGLIGARPGHNP